MNQVTTKVNEEKDSKLVPALGKARGSGSASYSWCIAEASASLLGGIRWGVPGQNRLTCPAPRVALQVRAGVTRPPPASSCTGETTRGMRMCTSRRACRRPLPTTWSRQRAYEGHAHPRPGALQKSALCQTVAFSLGGEAAP